MSPTITSIDQIDYDISVAYIALGVARASFSRCPSGENAQLVHEAEGTVKRKITSDTEAAGRTVKASKDDPQYEVESEKSGGRAVHKPSALHKD